MLLRAFCTDSSCLLLILAMNLSFVISNDHLEGGTAVPLQLCIKKKLSYKSEVNCIFQNDTKLHTVFIWEGFKIMYVFFSELVLNRFYECISPINFGI